MRITTQNLTAIKPQLADLLTNIKAGDTIKGKLIELLGQSISIRTASGQVLLAALMKTADLKVGQAVELYISSITEEGIFAELKTDNQIPRTNEAEKLKQLLSSMDIKPEGTNLQAAKLLVKYNMPVTKENVINLLNTQKSLESLAQGDASKAVALLQSEQNINNTEVTKLVKITAALEPQSQQILRELLGNLETTEYKTNTQNAVEPEIREILIPPRQLEAEKSAAEIPRAALQKLAAEVEAEALKQEFINNAVKLEAHKNTTKHEPVQAASKQEPLKLDKLIDSLVKLFETVSKAEPEQTAYLMSKDIKITPAAVKAIVDNTMDDNKLSKLLEGAEKLIETLDKNQIEVTQIKQELKKLFLEPKQLQVKERISENYKDIVKLGTKLETLVREQGLDNKVDTAVLQDIKGNIDFVRSINSNINYLQIPVQINESKTTAEIYVFNNKKRSKNINPENATILIALDLNRLGHVESLIAVSKKNVNITFRVEKEAAKKLFSSSAEQLRQALEARGYCLNPLQIIDVNEKFNLLKLEELINTGSEQLHIDLKV